MLHSARSLSAINTFCKTLPSLQGVCLYACHANRCNRGLCLNCCHTYQPCCVAPSLHGACMTATKRRFLSASLWKANIEHAKAEHVAPALSCCSTLVFLPGRTTAPVLVCQIPALVLGSVHLTHTEVAVASLASLTLLTQPMCLAQWLSCSPSCVYGDTGTPRCGHCQQAGCATIFLHAAVAKASIQGSQTCKGQCMGIL